MRDGAIVELRPVTPDDGEVRLIGHGCLIPTGPDSAEVAFAVADAEQGLGLATLLLERLVEAAQRLGITRLTADVDPYRLDLGRCRELLTATGAALHPGLDRLAQPTAAAARRPGRPRARILFLCTGNSARSQMAEAMAEQLAPDTVEAFSAGSHPKRLHPNAVRAMRERGIDIADRCTKHLSAFAEQHFDAVITLCDRVREVCPGFPGQPTVAHWSMPDPARAADDDGASYPAFQRTATEIAERVSLLLELLAHTPIETGAEHARR
jgi:protein-tyrosine-phosphatase